MNFKRKWLKKSNVLFVSNFHISLLNVKAAINYSVNIANCNSNSTVTIRTSMLITISPTEAVDGMESVELLRTR